VVELLRSFSSTTRTKPLSQLGSLADTHLKCFSFKTPNVILNTKKSLLDSYLDKVHYGSDLSKNSYGFKTDINITTTLYDTN
jgi:hypothetical protein